MPSWRTSREAELRPACDEDLEAGSQQFTIPAVKPAPQQQQQQQQVFSLNAWPAHLGAQLPAVQALALDAAGAAEGFERRSRTSTGSAGAQASGQQKRQLQQAWDRLSTAASSAVAWAARLVPLRWMHCQQLPMSPRTNSLEALSLGQEQSAVYVPGKQQDVAVQQCPGQLAAARWQRACQAVLAGREAAVCLELLSNRLAPPADRLHAAIQLKMQLAACPPERQQRLAAELQAGRRGGKLRLGEHVVNEFYTTGERIFGFFTPPAIDGHHPYFIPALTAALVLVFFFMAGQYGQYQMLTNPGSTACLAAMHRNGTAPAWGPGAMVRWIAPKQQGWCYAGKAPGKFDAQYLIDWGARWAPDMRHSPQRWLTSALVHQSFSHLLSNIILLLGLGWPMEAKHGTWRIALLAAVAAAGGNLLSAVTEDACTAVVGTSGVVFGMAGVTLADMVLNFETLARPLLRAAVLFAFLVFFGVTVGTTPTGTSHMSHVGGLLTTLLAALIILPNVDRGRTEMAVVALAAAGFLAIAISLPLVFYLQLLPHVCCGCAG